MHLSQLIRDAYSKDVEDNETRLKELDDEIENLKNQENKLIDVESILKKYTKIKELNKFIIDEFIEKIYIGKLDKEKKTREIKIEWNLDL